MSMGDSVIRGVQGHMNKDTALLPPLKSPSPLGLSNSNRTSKTLHTGGENVQHPQKADVNEPQVSEDSMRRIPSAKQTQRRIQQLERAMLFMKNHHETILDALHQEVEVLKRKNNELIYQQIKREEEGLQQKPTHSHRITKLPRTRRIDLEALPQSGLFGREKLFKDAGTGTQPEHTLLEKGTNTDDDQLEHSRSSGDVLSTHMLQRELADCKGTLETERTHNSRLCEELRELQQIRPDESPDNPSEVELERRLHTAETTIIQLTQDCRQYQKQMEKMRNSVQHRPPWRFGTPIAPPKSTSTQSSAANDALPRLNLHTQGHRISANSIFSQFEVRSRSSAGRIGTSLSGSQDSLPVLLPRDIAHSRPIRTDAKPRHTINNTVIHHN